MFEDNFLSSQEKAQGKPWSCLSRIFPPFWENLGAVSPGGSLPLGKPLELSLQEVPSLVVPVLSWLGSRVRLSG